MCIMQLPITREDISMQKKLVVPVLCVMLLLVCGASYADMSLKVYCQCLSFRASSCV